ncbi:MAG: nuclear transport factor 2 family protein [Cyclobacteriaceae bacterium]
MKALLTSVLLLITTTVFAQDENIHALLQEQIAAFNGRNIDALTANVSEDFKWYYIGTDSLFLEVSGKGQFRNNMESYFESIAEVKSEIAEYTIDNNRISFKEVVEYTTASGQTGKASAMGIYEVKDGLIFRAWYFL